MTLGKPSSNLNPAPTTIHGELITDYRARLAQQQRAAAERRQQDLAEQISELKTPSERIRIWERLHALNLPREAVHPLLRVIARSTGLTVGHLHAEQKQRLSPTKDVAPVI